MNIVHAYVKATNKDYYYVSGAALFADPEVQPLMGMAYKTFRKHKYGLDEPYENEHVIVKKGVLLGPDKEEGQAEMPTLLFVCSARALSNGCKSRVSPNSGNYIAKGKGVHREVKSERSQRQTSDLTDRNFI